MPGLIHNKVFQTSDGCAIAYTLRPATNLAAPNIVLIHSLGLDGSIWDGVVAALAGQAAVLTYDCRGHGSSCREAGRSNPNKFTPELFARDVAELLDHVGWQTATVAGCSMGGCVSQAFAAIFPSRASALMLIDTTAWYGEDAPAKWRERGATARANGLGSMAEFQVGRWFGEKFRAQRPDLVKAALDVFVNNDVDCFAASCEPIEMARHLHDAIPGSTLTILPGARHITPMECPGEIASKLLEIALLEIARRPSEETAAG